MINIIINNEIQFEAHYLKTDYISKCKVEVEENSLLIKIKDLKGDEDIIEIKNTDNYNENEIMYFFHMLNKALAPKVPFVEEKEISITFRKNVITF